MCREAEGGGMCDGGDVSVCLCWDAMGRCPFIGVSRLRLVWSMRMGKQA